MGKKKRGGSSGGGGGGGGGNGGGGQQQKPADDGEEQAPAAPNAGDASPAEGNKDKEHEKGKDSDKEKDQQEKGAKGKDKDGKKQPPMVTAVLKVDMHCDGCAKRIHGSVHRYPGVEGVAMEVEKGSMTVVGRFDAKKLRDRVADKTRKHVDLVGGGSGNNKGGGGAGGGGNGKQGGESGGGNQHKGATEVDGKQADKGGEQEGKENTKADRQQEVKGKDDKQGGGGGKGKGGGKDNKKPVVPVVATVVLKIGSTGLHCDGCMNRIRSKLFKIKGVEQVRMDMGKNQVTVTGTMDAKALPEKLRKKLRRPVDVVAPGKDKDGKEKDGKEGAGKDGKDGGGKDGKDAATKALKAELEAWKAAFYDQQSLINAEFMLSDENPNACAVM
ncbi:heavy metal-associated isoprenylated plant protein 3-like [Miscanthus floridulus]|uniref:heavy metal-associated isoprenylated plant protein 3-like n=1 Tax=Miscanthus floridulus TaxID=154761 RepID=UPI003459DF3B